MKPRLSVIICTHNPLRTYLDRVLNALQKQTLPYDFWELLLIDNASDRPLAKEIDLNWHPQFRYNFEPRLGLTPARLRGIKESIGDVLVFVDDDNVLNEDYLEVTLQISSDWAMLGAWGGQIKPEFERTPPEWTKTYWPLLALREFDRDRWSNASYGNEALPCGAGLCVRRCVAQKYVDLVLQDTYRLNLDRIGNSLSSCGDSDLALTTCDVGLGSGSFTALRLTHLLPTYRLQESYLLKLVEGIARSSTILKVLREGSLPISKSRSERIFEAYRLTRISKRDVRFHQARERGIAAACQEIMAITSKAG